MRKDLIQPGLYLDPYYVGRLWQSIAVFERANGDISWYIRGSSTDISDIGIAIAVEGPGQKFRKSLLVVLPDHVGWIELAIDD